MKNKRMEEYRVDRIARIIEPVAFQTFDDLTPTERDLWNAKQQRLLIMQGRKPAPSSSFSRNRDLTAMA